MPIDKRLLEAAGKKLNRARRVLIASHVRPDGDAVGSLLGLGLALSAAGKQVQMILADGVPANFRHLPGADLVRHHLDGDTGVVVILDSSDLERVGDVLTAGNRPDLNLDHHVTNLNFAKLNLVDTEAVATAAMLAEFLPRWGFPITAQVASALLTGIITDTLGFRTANVTPRALRIAATLMEHGAHLPELYARALIDRSFEALRLWGFGLSRLQRQGRMVWTSLNLEDRQSAGYPGRDDADLINVLSAVRDCDVALIFIEQPTGKVKVSWRAMPGFDVSRVALRFGGGGHSAAAGAMVEGDLEHVQRTVLGVTQKLIEAQILERG